MQKKPKSKRRTVINYFKIATDALREFTKNDPLRMAGATAFFTTFALPPILLIIIQVLGLVIDPRNIGEQLFIQLSENLGRATTLQVIETLRAFRKMSQNWLVTILGFVFLLFVATTLFKIIKNSLNQIWKIKVVRKQNFVVTIKSRMISVLVILVAGILFITGIITEGMQAYLGDIIGKFVPAIRFYFTGVLNYIFSLILVTIWITLLFRYLPDGRPQWRVALVGGFVTSILFNFGKYALRYLLPKSNISNFYGASGSIVLLLLFVFYSALILYYGASFTKIWGMKHGRPIQPLPRAIRYQLSEVEEV